MLVVDPHLTGSTYKVVFRKSMKKFTTSDTLEIEVIRTTSYMNCYLNRQIITLLDSHGVDAAVFLSLQAEMLDRLRNANINPEEARSLLQMHFRRRVAKETEAIIRKHPKIALEDHYIQGIINAIKAQHIRELETRARVHVEEGCCLIGGLDEYEVLQPRQVFIQYTPPNSTTPIIKTGKVMVAKFPCLHPGDILLLEAVNHAALHHINNMIIFPQKGDRPLPNQTAGSDLDGDIYFITWQESLFPAQQIEPMDYTAPDPPRESTPEHMIEDVIKFFGKYIINDNLGKISTAHVYQYIRTNDCS